jgi:trigger factor
MKVSAETLENRQTRLTIEASPEEVESAMEKTYRRLAKKVVIPGFRKGKAPRSVMERFIGKEALLEEALDDLVPETYNKAIEEQGLEPIAQPQIEVVERQPVKYKALVSLKPIIDLGDYRYVRLDPEKPEVTQEEIDKTMDRLQHQQAPWEPIEGPVSFNDMVVMDVKGNIGDEVIIDQKGIQYQVLQGSRRPVAGFAEKLEGMAKGETRDFSLSFPEDYPDKKVTGKEASYKVTVHEIKRKSIPELNDEFAKSLGEGFDTLDALRQHVTKQLQKISEDEAKRRFEEKALETVVGFSKIQYPMVMLDHEIEHMIEDQARQSGQYGQQGLDNYLKNIGKTADQLKEELKPAATEHLIRSLVLGKLADEEKITIEHEEIDAEIDTLAQMGGAQHADEMRKNLSTEEGHHAIEQRLMVQKTLERMAQIAMGQAKKESQTPAAEASPAETPKSSEAGQ